LHGAYTLVCEETGKGGAVVWSTSGGVWGQGMQNSMVRARWCRGEGEARVVREVRGR
jgi:hypothetical protein